jgi:hypothetical protein
MHIRLGGAELFHADGRTDRHADKREELNEFLFSGRQLRQMCRFFDGSGTNSFPIFEVCWWFGGIKTDD